VLEHPNIRFATNSVAVDLLTGKKLGLNHNHCLGAYVLNEETGKVATFSARFTVLATGGASKAYLYTSNPDARVVTDRHGLACRLSDRQHGVQSISSYVSLPSSGQKFSYHLKR
jgi:aspartate oxidase